jgi:hypothetical protein
MENQAINLDDGKQVMSLGIFKFIEQDMSSFHVSLYSSHEVNLNGTLCALVCFRRWLKLNAS